MKVSVKIESLVESNIHVLATRDFIRKCRNEIPSRSIGKIGRKTLIIVWIDILQTDRTTDLVEIGAAGFDESVVFDNHIRR